MSSSLHLKRSFSRLRGDMIVNLRKDIDSIDADCKLLKKPRFDDTPDYDRIPPRKLKIMSKRSAFTPYGEHSSYRKIC